MSGHSKWSTIKRQKEVTDKAKGKLFSKLAKAIGIAIKTGGGIDPETNSKLRVAIDTARMANMPKANIERILSKGAEIGDLQEVTYEGFGPEGIAVIVESTTDNRNRTGQEIKGIFERAGGHLAGRGAVSFNYEPRGLVLVKKSDKVEEQMLKLIDLGAEEIEDTADGIEIFVPPELLGQFKEKLLASGFGIVSSELTQKPKNYLSIENGLKAAKVLSFLDTLSEHDDVQKVFANVDIPQDILAKIS